MDIKYNEVESDQNQPDEELGSMEVKPLIGAPEPSTTTHAILLRLEDDIQNIAMKNKAEVKIKKNLIAHFKSLKPATKEE